MLGLTRVDECRTCGHTEYEHSGIAGPNSIGQWFTGKCVHASTVVWPYRFGGCQCQAYVRSRKLTRMATRKQAGKAGAMKRKGLSDAASKRIAGLKRGKKK